jgi:hypothetical protein
MDWIYPIHTGHTFFDVWTIFHQAFWLFAGSCFWAFRDTIEKPRALVVGLVMAYGWEVFERYAERRWPDRWLNPESWLNSYVSDPLTCVVGILAAWYALDNWRL